MSITTVKPTVGATAQRIAVPATPSTLPKKRFDPSIEFAKIHAKYLEEVTANNFNALVLGRLGTGKTTSIATLPKPVLVHSFDPGGSKSLKRYTDDPNSGIYVESFEHEDSNKPTEYNRWEKRFRELSDSGAFEYFASYVIDSATTFNESLMNAILLKGNRAGTLPQIQDYGIQILTFQRFVHDISGKPINFVMLGHLKLEKDEFSGKVTAVPLVTGQLKEKLPTLFDEVYIAISKPSSTGSNYLFLTQHEGYYEARSRLAANGKLEKHEPQDFKSILQKTGYPFEDKQNNNNQ